MLFNSFPFIFIFLPIALVGFYVTSWISRGLAKLWLVLASLAFYTYWHPPFTVLLLISIGFNYLMGSLILNWRETGNPKPLLAFAIAANLLALFYYKYAYVLAESLVRAGITQTTWMDHVLLPLGISFFTFTQIGFLVDCGIGRVKDKSFVNYMLFVTFFPHLIAGPILHHKEIMPQFGNAATYRFNIDNVARGAALFSIGLFKKVLLADQIAAYADSGFADPAPLALFGAWGTALCYSLQLYFDFSGYSDMAIGIARMCNVQFPFNFNSPYKATNIIDFWQRWHMTLTRYLNLYLFNPLALWITRRRAAQGLPVSQKALAQPRTFLAMVALPMFFTMSLAGIWHGAGLQFLIFGLLHAVYLTINHAWRVFQARRRGRNPPPPSPSAARSGAVAGLILTYLAVLVGQVFFRADSSGSAVRILGAMVGAHGVEPSLTVPAWLPSRLGGLGSWLEAHHLIAPVDAFSRGGGVFYQLVMMAALYAIVWLMPNSQEIVGLVGEDRVTGVSPTSQPAPKPAWLRLNAGWGMAAGVGAIAAILGIGAKSEFLYFQF